MPRRRRTPRPPPLLLDAPLAVATDGTLIANVTHAMAEISDDPQDLLAEALASGRQVFLGVALTESEIDDAKKRLDDAAAEVVAMVVEL